MMVSTLEYSATLARPGSIHLICAGLGRTGTLSLTEALEILQYNPYHYIGDFKHGHASTWADLADGKCSADDVVDLIVRDGYDAVLENPTCDIYRDILKRFPEAKVVLTVRDSPEKFEASWKTLFETMVVTEEPFKLWPWYPSFFGWIPLFRQLKKIRYFMGTTHLKLEPGSLTHGWRQKPSGWIADQYVRHNQDVIDHVPSDQLLIFNVKEGWKPLCDFLGCEVPNQEFPHSKVNDARALKRMRTFFLIVIYGWVPAVAATAVGTFLAGRRMMLQDHKRA
eukprot:scaffold41317_cov47-Attheya_sp.AAC.4